MKVGKIHIILFILTVLTTFATGLSFGGTVLSALAFSGALLFILGSHEMGHYFYGKKYGVDITPPYFIPAPPFISPIGTFGAFIKIKSPISTRKALFDIGIAGPLAGIIASVPVLLIGIRLSTIVDVPEGEAGQGLVLGSPLIFTFFSGIFFGKIPEGKDLFLHPVAFAGWVGLFVTALNLIPSGQLDGGHIVYSLFSKKTHKTVSVVMIALLIIFGIGTEPLFLLYQRFAGAGVGDVLSRLPEFEGWPGWILWAVLLTLIGTKHPPTIHDEGELDTGRKLLGFIALLIFIGCITPVPIKLA
ncbi:MAG: site-2 protease family protein [Thermodesulfobacteriota bacterium]